MRSSYGQASRRGSDPAKLNVGKLKALIESRTGRLAKQKNETKAGESESELLKEARAAIQEAAESIMPPTPPASPARSGGGGSGADSGTDGGADYGPNDGAGGGGGSAGALRCPDPDCATPLPNEEDVHTGEDGVACCAY